MADKYEKYRKTNLTKLIALNRLCQRFAILGLTLRWQMQGSTVANVMLKD